MKAITRRVGCPSSGLLRALVFFSLVLAGPAASIVQGTVFTLTDDNSVAQFDTQDAVNHRGMFSWTVDGVQQLPGPSANLPGQWFWYRVGNTAESAIDTLPVLVQGVSDTDFNGSNETLFVKYGTPGLTIQTRFSLDGGTPGSGASDMGEQISITNTGNSNLDFHFFQYADFDLQNTAAFDTALFVNANTVRQNEGNFRLTETIVTPPATHREIDFFPNTLNRLNDGLPTTLSDTPPSGTALGPGDVTWAFQWDVIIPAGGTFQISKDKNLNLVPEPSSMVLLGLGIVAAAGYAWRRRRDRCA